MDNLKTLIDVLNDPKGRQLIDAIDHIGQPKDQIIKEIKENLIKDLKIKFNYNY